MQMKQDRKTESIQAATVSSEIRQSFCVYSANDNEQVFELSRKFLISVMIKYDQKKTNGGEFSFFAEQ